MTIKNSECKKVKHVDRKNTNSIKWDLMCMIGGTADDLPMWMADMDYAVYEGVTKALKEAAKQPALGYTFTDDSYKEAFCGWFKRNHSIDIKTQWVTPTLNVIGTMQIVANTLLEEGDGVMLFTPIYPSFYDILKNRNLQKNECSIFPGEEIDWCEAEKQISASKAVIFCNPHNPLAKVWKEEELKKFADLCAKYDVWVLSDDVHCDMAMFGNHYTSLLNYECIKEKLLLFTSAAKSFNLAGLGGCNLVIPGDELRGRIVKQLNVFKQTELTIYSAAGIKAAYQGADEWVVNVRNYMEDNVKYVMDYCKKYMPKVTCIHEGTFLMWLDLRQLGMKGSEINKLFRREHVLIDDGVRYGNAGEGFFRANIACSRSMLREVMQRFRKIYNEIIKGEE